MSLAVTRVCERLTGVQGSGDNLKAKCPAHEDRVASLSIGEGSGGRVLLHCHAGCAPTDIVAAAGLTFTDLFPPNDGATAVPDRGEEAYSYTDAEGVPVYQVVRMAGKDFRQRRPDGSGGWIWKMTGVKRVPFRLPELQGVETVFVVEGEKDSNRLWSHSIPATTNCGGAGKWGASETKALKAAGCTRVVVLPDNDRPGLSHAENVAQRCRGAGMAATVILLPGLDSHGDVSDWLSAGNSPGDLLTLVGATPYIVPPAGAVAALPELPAPAATIFDDPANAHRDPATEAAFGERFAEEHSHIFRFDIRRKAWLKYEEPQWKLDPGKVVRRAALDYVRARQVEAVTLVDMDKRRRLLKFGIASETKAALDHIVSIAEWQPGMMDSGEGWNADPWLLGVPNGVVDLRTGNLRAGHADDRITMVAGVPYDAEAQCPRWWRFLMEVFENDTELVDFAWKLAGYMLTGRTTEQIITICYGPGGNGKSRFLSVLKAALGDYGATLPFSSLTHVPSGNEPSNDLAALEGKRLITASEINEGARLNEARLKSLTGEDAISARFLYGEHFTFMPVGKLIFSVNHKPVVKDDSHGFWRRVRLLPFMHKFEGAERDLGLAEKLTAEMPGILAWAVQGCTAWQEAGALPIPEAIRVATSEYEADSDQLAEFIQTRCEVHADETTPGAALYKSYQEWCDANRLGKYDRLTSNAFGRLLGSKFRKKHTAGGSVYIGLAVKTGIPGLRA